MMLSLVDFLTARLADDQRVAEAATPGPWRWDLDDGNFDGEPIPDGPWGHVGPDLMSDGQVEEVEGYGPVPACVITSIGHDADHVIVTRADADHIARHDPSRVLADVAAKRRLIDALGPIHEAETGIRYGHERYVACSCGWDRVLQDRERHDWEDRYEEHLRDEGAYGFDARPFLLVLAQPFADHPEFDPAWRQTT